MPYLSSKLPHFLTYSEITEKKLNIVMLRYEAFYHIQISSVSMLLFIGSTQCQAVSAKIT